MLFSRRQTLQIGAAVAATAALPTFARAASRTLVVAVPQSPSALEPVLRNDTATLQTVFNLYDRLLSVDLATGQVKPGLAASWEKADARTYVFTLREGIRFHDGSPMTPADVVFSFSRTRTSGPQNGVSVAAQYQHSIASVEALDAARVKIVTADPDPALLLKLGGWTTEIVSKAAFDTMGGWERWAKAPVGTGPYKLVENRQDERMVIEANPYYWGGKPSFDRIEFRVVPEAVVRANGLVAGDFDMATLLAPEQIAQVKGAKGLECVGGPIQNIRTLNFATASGVLKPPEIRRAISHAIDRQAMVDAIWQNMTKVPHGFQDPAIGDVFLADVDVPAYDPDLARTLIKQAGYGGEAITYRAQSSAYPLELQTSQVIVEMLRDVGLNVELQIRENWDQVYQTPFESVIWNESTLFAWPDPSGGLIRLYGPTGQFQRAPFNWHNDSFSRLSAEFQTTDDIAKRRDLHRQLLQIVQQDDPPATVLFYNALFYGKRTDVPWAPYPTLYADYGPGNPATRA